MGLLPIDRIVLYSLSGKALKQAIGVSQLKLDGLSSQVIVVRVYRSKAVLRSGMVMVQ
jgi:hypothetical protein